MHEKLKGGNLDPKEVEKAIAGQKEDFPDGISECGTDAMRFALCDYTAQGKSINLDINKVISYRHFCNKIWNATKFFLMYKPAEFIPQAQKEQTLIEKWILSKLHTAIEKAEQGWKSYDFSIVCSAIHKFWQEELCDVFLEVIKPHLDNKDSWRYHSCLNTLYICLEFGLRLLHPFMPFVTEELYQRLPRHVHTKASIMISPYPTSNDTQHYRNEELEKKVEMILEAVHHARSLRSTSNVSPAATPQIYLVIHSEDVLNIFKDFVADIAVLVRASEVDLKMKGKDQDPPSGCAVDLVNHLVEVHLVLKGLVDPTGEIQKLRKKVVEAQKQIEVLQKRMSVPNYDTKVPENVRLSNSEKLNASKTEIDNLNAAILKFEALKI